MNKLRSISIVVLVIAMCLSVACETEKIIFDGPYFVRFTDVALTEKESHTPVIKVEVHYSNPKRTDGDVIINYIVGGSAREGVDYVINGTRGKVRIKSGEWFGYIEVKLINNANNILRSQDVTFTLITAEVGDQVQVGFGPSQIGKAYTLTIQDDCILGGDYYGVEDEGGVPVEDITITSLDCENYTLSNWNIDPYSILVTDLTFIDNGDNTLTIPPQEESSLPTEEATIDGFGVVDPVTRRITFTVRFVDVENQPTLSFILIPN